MKRDPLPEPGDAEGTRATVLHRFVFANLEVPADEAMYFRLRGLTAGTLDEAAYVTSDRPPRQVRLGIVITHFNRQAQVVPAIGRIERALLARPALRDQLTLTVVDNSRNLGLASSEGV